MALKSSTESSELRLALAAAEAGAAIVRHHFQSGLEIREKKIDGEGQGLVTAADLESEQVILTLIRETFPEDAILAEESDAEVDREGRLWVVDPLDGTNNFAHGIPHFAVSIGFYEAGQAQCGVVLNPIQGDRFTAERGRGAAHNGRPVHVNDHRQLDETMIAVGFYYDRGDMMRRTLRSIEALFEQKIQGIRRMGTAALDLVQVGLGRFGGYFEYTLSPWDFAAAALFVEEAGGRVTTCTGDPLPLRKTSVLASNGHLHETLLKSVGETRGGARE